MFVLSFMKMHGYFFRLCPSHYQAVQSLTEFLVIVHITMFVLLLLLLKFDCFSFDDPHIKISPIQGIPYKSPDKQARATHQMAVTGK